MVDHRRAEPPRTGEADPLRRIQEAARAAAWYAARRTAARVVVLGECGCVLLDVVVPAGEPVAEDRPAASGWAVTDRRASYDGAPVAVAPSRLKLLRVLVEAAHPLTNRELTDLAFDSHTDEANTRYHIRELKKELAKAFTFEGDALQGDNDGYRLVLR